MSTTKEEPKISQEGDKKQVQMEKPANKHDKDNTAQPSAPPVDTTDTVAAQEPEQTPATQTENLSHLPENVRILKEAFPEIDVEVIETILQTQGNSVDSSFELLLGMSDPNYKSTPIPAPAEQLQPQQEGDRTPPMPPRPNSLSEDGRISNSVDAPYAYWERQPQAAPTTVEEQLRMDEEFAKKLALEDEMRNERRRQKQYQQQQQKRETENDDDSIFNLQEELPIIKEKMKEAGNAAKKKMMDFYNQIKANTRNNNVPHQHEAGASSSMPTTNAQYRGLPSDDGDDLLTGDISALHLSDYDVYAQTGGRQRKSNDLKRAEDNDTIHINPRNSALSNVQTSTSDAQLKADEDFARQLAEEDQLEARRSRQPSNENTLRAPQTSLRKSATPTVVIAPRSPLEFEGDSDYEDVGLTAASNNNNATKAKNDTTATEDNGSVPYVIGDDDDSDSDDLVDIDEDELFNEEELDAKKKDDNSAATKEASKDKVEAEPIITDNKDTTVSAPPTTITTTTNTTTNK